MSFDVISSSDYGVELRLTIREVSMIAEALKKCESIESIAKDSSWDKLTKDFQTMSNLTRIESLRKFGSFDKSRLNFQ